MSILKLLKKLYPSGHASWIDSNTNSSCPQTGARVIKTPLFCADFRSEPKAAVSSPESVLIVCRSRCCCWSCFPLTLRKSWPLTRRVYGLRADSGTPPSNTPADIDPIYLPSRSAVEPISQRLGWKCSIAVRTISIPRS